MFLSLFTEAILDKLLAFFHLLSQLIPIFFDHVQISKVPLSILKKDFLAKLLFHLIGGYLYFIFMLLTMLGHGLRTK
jgi:hypothetical protein